MLSRTPTLALLLAISARALAATGYVYGADHCYYFAAPRGWTMDNRAGATAGVPMVFYPSGTSWQSASEAIYTRPATSARDRPDPARIKEQVEEVMQMYRSASQNIQAKPLQAVRSKSGAMGELWRFTGYSNGGAELVTYFAAPETINFFVMQVSNAGDAESKIPAMLELSESYREATDCKPCSGAASCTIAN